MSDLVYAAAPVFTVDGATRGELARDVLRLEVEEDTAGLASLRLRLLAQGPRDGEPDDALLYLDGDLVDFGQTVEVSLGRPEEERRVFTGVVSGIEASFAETSEPEVVVLAEDALMKLRMTRRFRTYERVSDAGIAEAIASEHGLSAAADAPGPTYDRVQQLNLTDLEFLRERAALVQAEVWVEDGSLHFSAREDRGGPEIELTAGVDLLGATLRADLAHQRSEVHVSGYDASQRMSIDEVAAGDVLRSEATGGTTGPELLERVFGARPTYRASGAPLTVSEATGWARAEMLRRGRGFVTVVGRAVGTPAMKVGSRLTLAEVGRLFDGAGYRVVRVRHTWDLTEGFRTDFEAERPVVGVSS